jgi:hypothetical protein
MTGSVIVMGVLVLVGFAFGWMLCLATRRPVKPQPLVHPEEPRFTRLSSRYHNLEI